MNPHSSRAILAALSSLLWAPICLQAVKSSNNLCPEITLQVRYKNREQKENLIRLAAQKYASHKGYLSVMRSSLIDVKYGIDNKNSKKIYQGLTGYTWAHSRLSIRSWKNRRDQILKLNRRLKKLMKSDNAQDFFATDIKDIEPIESNYSEIYKLRTSQEYDNYLYDTQESSDVSIGDNNYE